jgi:hypothetical protein
MTRGLCAMPLLEFLWSRNDLLGRLAFEGPRKSGYAKSRLKLKISSGDLVFLWGRICFLDGNRCPARRRLGRVVALVVGLDSPGDAAQLNRGGSQCGCVMRSALSPALVIVAQQGRVVARGADRPFSNKTFPIGTRHF